jgi:PIN domain nuclease of toxin-antitoxin system
VAWLHHAGRVTLPVAPLRWRASLLGEGLLEIPLDGEVAVAAVELPDFHQDPADRLIVATARDEGARLLTSDRRILGWAGAIDRVDARR